MTISKYDYKSAYALARELAREGLMPGEIAHRIDWPVERSLRELARVIRRDVPARARGVAVLGPVYRSRCGG